MHIFVDEFVVDADAVARDRLFGHQRRFGKSIVNIIENQGRHGKDVTVVDEGWHHTIRIKLQINGVFLISL